MSTTITPTGRRVFPGISSRTWEHPADRAALAALRAVPGFDLVVRWVFGMFTERVFRALYLGGAVEVGPEQMPRLHKLWQECLDVLDAPERYELFVTANPVLNAGAAGWDHPFVVLNSGTVQVLDDDQLRYVLAHELGHILSGHVLYKTMLHLLLKVSTLALGMPLTGIPLLAVLAALLEWDRKSELSADRAGLIVCQEPDHVRMGLLRMAGGLGEGANLEAFRAQAKRYEEGGNVLDGIARVLALLGSTHPFPVLRLREVDAWVETEEYKKILAGEVLRRADDPKESTFKAWADGAAHYGDRAREAAGPLGKFLRGVVGR